LLDGYIEMGFLMADTNCQSKNLNPEIQLKKPHGFRSENLTTKTLKKTPQIMLK